MSDDSRAAALSRAAAILNYRNRSSRMLYDKMIEKGFSPEDSSYAVERLLELSYLNDAEFASSVVREYTRRGYGRERIERKLFEYKLSRETIEEALSGFQVSEEKLCGLFSSFCKDITDRKEREKAAAKLIRRGYNFAEVNAAVRTCLENNEEN